MICQKLQHQATLKDTAETAIYLGEMQNTRLTRSHCMDTLLLLCNVSVKSMQAWANKTLLVRPLRSLKSVNFSFFAFLFTSRSPALLDLSGRVDNHRDLLTCVLYLQDLSFGDRRLLTNVLHLSTFWVQACRASAYRDTTGIALRHTCLSPDFA